MWSDNETTLDLLGFKVHADLIRSVVTDQKLLPITIGVFGDWGGGKTSVMKMLQRDLDPKNYAEGLPERAQYDRVLCLYFNGWLFEGYDDAKSALLSSILVELGKNDRFGPKVRKQVTALLESVDWMRLARLGFKEIALPAALAYMTGGASILPSVISSAKSLFGLDRKDGDEAAPEAKFSWDEILKSDIKSSGPMDVRTFRKRFSEMLKDSDIESLVILIDDLDRCSPERIIENLEAIKLFLSVERTAFVIGADPRIVRHAIATVYNPERVAPEGKGLEAQTDIVTDYLEKLIQVPYQLPRLSPAEVETYMAMLFCHQCLEGGAFSGLRAALDTHRGRDRYSVFSYGAIQSTLGNLPAELSNNLTFCARSAPLITEGLKGNPRQVKRFLNAFILRKKLAETARLTGVQDDVLVKLMVLEYAHLKQFNQLYKWQSSQDGLPLELQRLEKALCPPEGNPDNEDGAKDVDPEWGTTFIRRWVAMEPYLSKVDLRDYFWVARDRLQSTMSDVSMVPPLVRQALESVVSDIPAKRQIGLNATKELHADELAILLSLIVRHVQRHPSEKSGFDGLRLLVENDITGGLNALIDALNVCPADQLPPAVGNDLRMLVQVKPATRNQIDPVIAKLRETNTRIGAALRPGRDGR